MAKPQTKITYEAVNAAPVKSFFVSMLTRDISLADAILDLLDNCVDGILRKGIEKSGKPYEGYYAEITFDKDTFEIKDNCGGIPWSLHEYAFRMGRADGDRDKGIATVGTYGIGMKRALFKIGEKCLISTQNNKDNYEVDISADWIADETEWKIPVRAGSTKMAEDGTVIVIGDLHDGIKSHFSDDKEAFESDFVKKVATHYAFIIAKGFSVKVNKHTVHARPTELVFTEGNGKSGDKTIRPFIYRTKTDGVSVFLAIGFTRPIPSQEDVQNDQQEKQHSSLDAGWTVICNDRAVLYCEKTELTGWGEAGIPSYHTQFIAISGIVEFTSNDASKLPTTTTKRGIDASSKLYLQVKNKMREGMAIFTDYTNKWKGRADESRVHVSKAVPKTVTELKQLAENLSFTNVDSKIGGTQYRPRLPLPEKEKPEDKPISFRRPIEQISAVSSYLFDKPDEKPSKVGERCFDELYKEASK